MPTVNQALIVFNNNSFSQFYCTFEQTINKCNKSKGSDTMKYKRTICVWIIVTAAIMRVARTDDTFHTKDYVLVCIDYSPTLLIREGALYIIFLYY